MDKNICSFCKTSILLLELFFINSGNSGVLIPRLRFATIAAACKAITIVIKYTKKLGRYKILKDITTKEWPIKM